MRIKGSWQDAMLYEADAGGAGGGSDAGDAAPFDKLRGDPAVKTPTVEELQAQLADKDKSLKLANAEAKQRREKLEAIEAADAKRKEAELTETQKAAARADKAEADLQALQERHRKSAIYAAIRLAAKDANFADPEDAVLLAELTGVEVGDDDRVAGADAAVKALAKAKPHLIKAAARPGAPNINAAEGGQPRALTGAELVEQRRSTDNIYVPF